MLAGGGLGGSVVGEVGGGWCGLGEVGGGLVGGGSDGGGVDGGGGALSTTPMTTFVNSEVWPSISAHMWNLPAGDIVSETRRNALSVPLLESPCEPAAHADNVSTKYNLVPGSSPNVPPNWICTSSLT